MAKIPFTLPTIQNWNCHNCGGCCKQHAITLRDEDVQRLISQKWEQDPHIGPLIAGHSGRLFEKEGGLFSKSWTRLAHQPDGSCLFLDEKGLCRVHAKFGEPEKPLACRIYPYAFHPAGKTMAVSLRFSCPSVAANLGRNVTLARRDIEDLIGQTTPSNFRDSPPPELKRGQPIDWADVLLVTGLLENQISDSSVPLELALVRTLFWTSLLEQASYEKITGSRVAELIRVVAHAAAEEIPELPRLDAPSTLSLTSFRLLAAQYSRMERITDRTFSHRWKLARAAFRFASGRGLTISLHPQLKPVQFDAIESPFAALPPDAVEPLRRLLAIKLSGIHYCGRPFYHTSVIEGYRALVLLIVSIVYIARWIAAGCERDFILRDDILLAITIADHHHGYSPSLGSASAKQRVRTLASKGDIERLVGRYLATQPAGIETPSPLPSE